MIKYPYSELAWLMKEDNRYILRMDSKESKYLYDLIASLDNPMCVEIGRLQGGSTLLMAYAGGRVYSIDLHLSKTVAEGRGAHFDAYLQEVLRLRGLEERVEIVVGDSQRCDTSKFENKVDVLFIDGEHTYEGVKRDYQNWIDTVKPGGHILFHDASGEKGTVAGVKKFVNRVPLKKIAIANSTVHFIKEK